MAVDYQRYRFTVDEYYRMAEAGIFDEDSRVELIEGEIIQMPPIGPVHQDSVDSTNVTFVRRFSDVARVRVQGPIRLGIRNEPEPDICLLRIRPEPYRASHPGPDDVLLVVETADTTLAADRRLKLPMYARAGIPEVWLVDLPNDVVHVYREPFEDGYRVIQTLRRGDRVAPLAFPDRELDVSDLLG
jgi:Uma2 family endonuclease